MKIRNGFVSNSSSSSFCIYGVELDFKKIPGYPENNSYEFTDAYTEKIEKEGLYIKFDYDCKVACLGREFSTIKDNETGKQFKQSTKEKIKKLLGKNVKCETIEQTYTC